MSAPINNQLNENHGIAATGLQQPHTAIPPTTNYHDAAGSGNPSQTNRHAATGVPPVNTAEHAHQNALKENQPNHINVDDKAARIGRDAYPPNRENATNNESFHAGVPQHEGLGKKHTPDLTTGHHDLDKKHTPEANATTGQHLSTADGTTKPSAGDKIKGNLEKIAGKITGNEAKVIKGENIAHGRV